MLTLWVILLIVFIVFGKGLEFISATIAIIATLGMLAIFLIGLGLIALLLTLI